jgi:hypothetical protein
VRIAKNCGAYLRKASPLRSAENDAKFRALLIEKLKYTIQRLRHEQLGQSSERGALLDQLELQLADLEEDAAQAEMAARSRSTAACSRRTAEPRSAMLILTPRKGRRRASIQNNGAAAAWPLTARADLEARRIRDLATAVVPNGAAHAQHEIRYCRGLQSTGVRSR